jgi:hypothetical protein
VIFEKRGRGGPKNITLNELSDFTSRGIKSAKEANEALSLRVIFLYD